MAAASLAMVAAAKPAAEAEAKPDDKPQGKRGTYPEDRKAGKPKPNAKHHNKQAGSADQCSVNYAKADRFIVRNYDPSLKAVQHLGPKRGGKAHGKIKGPRRG